jgi:hypothetical protein
MKVKWIALVVTTTLVVLAAVDAGASRAMPAAATARPSVGSPQEATENFYAWYLDYIGPRSGAPMHNPLVDGAYRTSGYLTPQFVQKVDELVAGFDRGGYDPFLLAQDVPEWVKVTTAAINGERATVSLRTSFERHLVTVRLVHAGNGWLIDGIGSAE